MSYLNIYTNLIHFSVNIITWNVATTQPPSPAQLSNIFYSEADFIAFGLQEVKSQVANRIVDSLVGDSWTNSIR